MKILPFCFLFCCILCASCSCHWVKTGYHYDCNDNYVEEGYYDCPENNPINSDINNSNEEKYVIITTELISKNYNYTKENYYQVNVTLKNSGNVTAQNVNCKIYVTRDKFPNIKTFDPIIKTYQISEITSGSNKNLSFGIHDIAIYGGPIYYATINVTYTDSKGKLCIYEKYYDI